MDRGRLDDWDRPRRYFERDIEQFDTQDRGRLDDYDTPGVNYDGQRPDDYGSDYNRERFDDYDGGPFDGRFNDTDKPRSRDGDLPDNPPLPAPLTSGNQALFCCIETNILPSSIRGATIKICSMDASLRKSLSYSPWRCKIQWKKVGLTVLATSYRSC